MNATTFSRAVIKLDKLWLDMKDLRPSIVAMLVDGPDRVQDAGSVFYQCLKVVMLEISVNVDTYEQWPRYFCDDDDFLSEVIGFIEMKRDHRFKNVDTFGDESVTLRKKLWGYINARFGDLYKMMMQFREGHICVFFPNAKQTKLLLNVVAVVFLETLLREMEISLIDEGYDP